MDDVIYKTKKHVLIVIVFQPRFQHSIYGSSVDTLTKCIG